MQYEVVYSRSLDMAEALKELEKKVRKRCENGWRPQGGISVATTPWVPTRDGKGVYKLVCQAMVK